jgi:hypothetical protein
LIEAVFEILGVSPALEFVRGRSLGGPFAKLTEGKFILRKKICMKKKKILAHMVCPNA